MKRWLIVLMLISLFLLSVLSGFIVNSFINFSKKEDDTNHAILADEKKEEIVDTNFSQVIVSPNAEVLMTEKFERCGHMSTKKEDVPREIINLSEDKVKEFYKGWNIDDFSTNLIKISRNSLGICNEHYVLRESDGYISINCKNDIGEYIFKGLTDIPVQYLPEEDLARLEQGIEVVGRDNLNKLLEDYE